MFDSLDDRLAHCSSWVRQIFHELESICRASGGTVTTTDDAKHEGRLFRTHGSRRVFCRLDPKIDSIGIGLSNNIREDVARTGRLRDQKNMAWITLRPDNAQDHGGGISVPHVADLIRQANESVRSAMRTRAETHHPAAYGFQHVATLHWEPGGRQFRLEPIHSDWRKKRCFIYVWFDASKQRSLNVGHTGQTFSGRFNDYVRWLNGLRKAENDAPIRRDWLSCFSSCHSGKVEIWIKPSEEDRAAREGEEQNWIARLHPILNRRLGVSAPTK